MHTTQKTTNGRTKTANARIKTRSNFTQDAKALTNQNAANVKFPSSKKLLSAAIFCTLLCSVNYAWVTCLCRAMDKFDSGVSMRVLCNVEGVQKRER